MTENEQREADGRLLEALLTEELRPSEGAARGPGPAEATPQRTTRTWSSWTQAAVALLGVGVVAMTATWGDERGAALQDPEPVEVVEPEDVEQFLELLATATAARLVGTEVVGAGRIGGPPPGGTDQLDRIRWAETARITGPTFELWREALRRCSGDQHDGNGVAQSYDFELVLPGNRVTRSLASVDGPRTQIWIASEHAISPDADLQALVDAACADIAEQRRLEQGRVDDSAQLLSHPTEARRLDVAAGLAAGCDLAARFPGLEELTLRGQPSAATWRAVRALKQLRRLELVEAELHQQVMRSICSLGELRAVTLRECTSAPTSGIAPSAPLRDLGALRKLETLHLSNADAVAVTWDLTQLASMPALREFGLRSPQLLQKEHLEAIGRTKLERLLLVDLQIDVDLSDLRHLPSLHDVVLVADLDDDQLRPLAKIPSRQQLTVRNAAAKGGFLDEVSAANPGCDVDWTLNARWFRTDYAFRHIERTWRVNR